MAIQNFSTFRIDGTGDVIKFGAADTINNVQLAGSDNTADYSGTTASQTESVEVGAGNTVIAGASTLNISALDLGSAEGTLITPKGWNGYIITANSSGDPVLSAKDGSAGAYTLDPVADVDFASYAISVNTDMVTAGLAFGSTAMPVVPGSVQAVSSDGHTVQLTTANDYIGIDPLQFAYLDAGQSTVLTASYQIQEGDQVTTFSDTVTVNGFNQAPVIDFPDSTLTGGVTRTSGSDDAVNGTIKFTDPNIADTHTATISGFSLNATGNAMPASTIAALENALTLDPVSESDGSGSIGWHFAISNSFVSSLPANQFIAATYNVNIDDGQGGITTTSVTAVIAGSTSYGLDYPYGDNATVDAGLTTDPSSSTLVDAFYVFGQALNITDAYYGCFEADFEPSDKSEKRLGYISQKVTTISDFDDLIEKYRIMSVRLFNFPNLTASELLVNFTAAT